MNNNSDQAKEGKNNSRVQKRKGTISAKKEDENIISYRHYNEQAQQIILNVYNTIRSEIGRYGATKKTSELTKVSIQTIQRIVGKGTVKNETTHKKKFSKLDDMTGDLLIKNIHEFYKKNIIPTIDMIFQKMNKDEIVFPYSYRNLCNYLYLIGFKFAMFDNRRVIMESPRLIQLRKDYLEKIGEYRKQQRNIVYLDEMFYDINDVEKRRLNASAPNCSSDKPVSKRIIIVHAGTKTGWIENTLLIFTKDQGHSTSDNQNELDPKVFETWFENQLIPNIPPNSVIILDNASYHNRPIDKVPNTSTKKQEIVRFLVAHGVDLPPNHTRQSLLDLVYKLDFKKRSHIDEIAKCKGHDVLHIPPCYSILNPCEFLWSSLKEFLINHDKEPNVLENVTQIVKDGVSATNKHWINSCELVVDLEKKYSESSTPIIIRLSSASDTSSATDSDQA